MQIKLLSIFIIGFSLFSSAQNAAKSPYSSYGIGEYGGLEHATFSGMGNNSIAFIDSITLNYNNPSSYAMLGKGQPLFSTGISARLSDFKSGNSHYNTGYLGINHFAIGIPFANNFGLAVGLKPFSRTGYQFGDSQIVNSEEMKYVYRGTGGTNELFGGFSASIFNFKGHRLSLGANLGYVFGSTENERISYINNSLNTSGGVENQGYTFNSINLDFGLNYIWKLSKASSLTIAGVYTPNLKLAVEKNEFLAYAANVSNPNGYSYLYETVENGTIAMPSTVGVGFNFVTRPKNLEKRSNVYELSINGEVKMMDWSNYETSFAGITTRGDFENTIRYGVGAQFVPHYNFLDRTGGAKYIYRIRYRVGFNYATLPIVVLNKQQSDMAVTAGFGFPVAIQRSSSSVNIGFTLGQRGNGSSMSINEKYLGINFGVTISPGVNDRWFRRFKID
ncbi:MAG: hypothetical protein PHQ74_07125 [Crocinitomicaceae bacterium]|nr:hypothetical protein [Crocinitomicaceae bacterium]